MSQMQSLQQFLHSSVGYNSQDHLLRWLLSGWALAMFSMDSWQLASRTTIVASKRSYALKSLLLLPSDERHNPEKPESNDSLSHKHPTMILAKWKAYHSAWGTSYRRSKDSWIYIPDQCQAGSDWIQCPPFPPGQRMRLRRYETQTVC